MLDSMVLAVSSYKEGFVLTGDPHFKQLSRTIFIASETILFKSLEFS